MISLSDWHHEHADFLAVKNLPGAWGGKDLLDEDSM